MTAGLRTRLSTMMFLEFFIWGAWVTVLGNHMDKLGFGDNKAAIFGLFGLASIFMPIVAGQITFAVMARESTNEPNRLVAAAVGLAQPKDEQRYGYLSEHHAFGETVKKVGDFAEDLAATMLASTLGIELDPDKAWDERKQLFVADKNRQFVTRCVAKSARGHKDGLWTTVLACAVMLMD